MSADRLFTWRNPWFAAGVGLTMAMVVFSLIVGFMLLPYATTGTQYFYFAPTRDEKNSKLTLTTKYGSGADHHPDRWQGLQPERTLAGRDCDHGESGPRAQPKRPN